MNKKIVTYPNSIRDLCGVDTVVFTYSKQVAIELRKSLSDDFQVVFHDLNTRDEDDMEWLTKALYYTHIFIITENDNLFMSGYALAYAKNYNPELVIGLNTAPEIDRFVKLGAADDFKRAESIEELVDIVKEY